MSLRNLRLGPPRPRRPLAFVQPCPMCITPLHRSTASLKPDTVRAIGFHSLICKHIKIYIDMPSRICFHPLRWLVCRFVCYQGYWNVLEISGRSGPVRFWRDLHSHPDPEILLLTPTMSVGVWSVTLAHNLDFKVTVLVVYAMQCMVSVYADDARSVCDS